MNNSTLNAEKKSGIYYIKNIANDKIYIGQSKNVESRRKEHKRDLKSGKHVNWHLQKSFEKYSELSFEFGVLERCDVNELNIKEAYYIDRLETMDRDKGYNLKSGGDRITFSQETLLKMSVSRKILCQDESYLIQMCWARSELSEQQVVDIKTMLYKDVTVEEIINKMDVTRHQVTHIKDNNSFSFILPEYNYYIKNREDIYRKGNRRSILNLYRQGYSFKEIANLMNINPVTPYRISKEYSTIHDNRCRMNNIVKSYNKRSSLIRTLSSMGYSAMKISRTLKIAKNIVYDILNDKYETVNSGGKIKVYRYKEAGI